MAEVFVDLPYTTCLVPPSDGDRTLRPCWHWPLEQEWKKTQVGFGAPSGSISSLSKPPFDFSTLGSAMGLSSLGTPQLPHGTGQLSLCGNRHLELEPLSTVPLLQGHHSSLALTALFRQILHIRLEPLAPKVPVQDCRWTEGFHPSLT